MSQGVVLLLLTQLGWNTFDTQLVCPEFALEGGRVDFALCHPPGKPRVFIEVKQVGKADGAERQLFEYAFHAGVPLVVLTDGREWSFFMPSGIGDYADRRVYKLDLIERDVAESAERLQRYLSFERVCSGEAFENARKDYENIAREREIRDALPRAWKKLVEEEDELLLELLADATEGLCGYRPEPNTTAAFLRQIVGDLSSAVLLKPGATPVAKREVPSRTQSSAEQPTGFWLLGEWTSCRSARETLIRTIEALALRDPSFLERFVALPRHGRTRRYIARDRAELYPGRPDLAEEHSHQLHSGYWLGINLSRKQVERVITLACTVADLRYGSDLILGWGTVTP